MEVFVNEVRLSFPDLRSRGRPPKDRPNEPGKYGCQGIIEPESPAHVALRTAVIAVAQAQWPNNWQAILGDLGNDKKCLRKGNLQLDGKGNIRPEYKDMMYVKASNANEPMIIGAKAKKGDGSWNILPASSGKPYGGCIVNLKIDVYAMDSKEKGRGIHATLQAVQFVRDGQAFAGAPATADGFGDVEGAVDEDAGQSMESASGNGGAATVGSSNADLGL